MMCERKGERKVRWVGVMREMVVFGWLDGWWKAEDSAAVLGGVSEML